MGMRLRKVVENIDVGPAPKTDTDCEIVVKDASYSFDNHVRAIDRMSFNVRSGEFVVIVGPSGCGKTTIQNIIAGLIPKQEGTVTIGGSEPLAGRKEVAYMFAQDALLPWRTVLENVLFGVETRSGTRRLPKSILDNAQALIDSVRLTGFENAYPRQLSHGMRQRAALARTFLMDSPVLLMDEPFGALDAHTKLTLENLVIRLWEGSKRTVLFITHDLAEAIMLADRILVCTARPGRIKAEIPVNLPRPRNVHDMQRSATYHELYQKIWGVLSTEMHDDAN